MLRKEADTVGADLDHQQCRIIEDQQLRSQESCEALCAPERGEPGPTSRVLVELLLGLGDTIGGVQKILRTLHNLGGIHVVRLVCRTRVPRRDDHHIVRSHE